MRLLPRGVPRDTNALYVVLTSGSIDELDGVYKRSWVRYEYAGSTLLTLALANHDPVQRVALANRLLDDGVDVTRWQPVQVLVGRNTHDFTLEAPLLQRLLDEGADVNRVTRDKRRGTPLEALAAKFTFSDDDLEPFYDVLLARPELDLLQVSSGERTVLENLRKLTDRRAELVRRAEQTLRQRGVTAPGS